MKKLLLPLALFGAMAVGLSSRAADEAKKEIGNCPVSGKPAKEDKTAEYLTKNVYFCCDGCPAAFKKDPSKFATAVNHQLVLTGQAKQVGCPFSGGPVKDDTKVKIDGTEVGFCCNNCKGKVEKAEDKVATVFATLAKGFTLQTTCPVSGKAIDVSKSVEQDGRKVFFCCGGCPDAFQKDPEKFASKLPPLAK